MTVALEEAAKCHDYAVLDIVLASLPADMSRRLAKALSNKLGPDPLYAGAAVYLGRHHGGAGAWTDGRRHAGPVVVPIIVDPLRPDAFRATLCGTTGTTST